jgi:hypothetical protein
MPVNPGAELSSINFGALIGGPLVAVIEAQTLAARATADFIKTVGFDDKNKPVYVEFKYPKEVQAYQPAEAAKPEIPATATEPAVPAVPAKPAVPAVYMEMKIEVPILTILPIPFIRVEEATIDFNAKINAMETSTTTTDLAIGGNLEVKQRWPGGSAKLNVSCSYQKKTSSGNSVERTYSMQIHVRATQDEMPAGMEKLLGILEGAIKSAPTGNPG